MHLWQICAKALVANLCRVHLIKICAWCTCYKFVRRHLLQICADGTCCKFMPSALDTNLCGMHLLQICAVCAIWIFVPNAYVTNLHQFSLVVVSGCCVHVFYVYFICFNKIWSRIFIFSFTGLYYHGESSVYYPDFWVDLRFSCFLIEAISSNLYWSKAGRAQRVQEHPFSPNPSSTDPPGL
jgi:hypothetical protein